MRFCAKCGHEIGSINEACPNCGYQNTEESNYYQNVNPVQNNYNYEGQSQKGEDNSTGMLIWAIVNLVCCCPPFGIPALIFAIIAKSADTAEEAQRRVNIAKILNIIGTICGILVAIFTIVITVVAAGTYSY